MNKKKLNLIGLKCPIPILKTSHNLKKMNNKEILEVISDDLSAEKDFKEFCKSSNIKILEIKKENKILFLSLKKV